MNRELSSPSTADRSREGYLYGLAAYGCWGLVPIYFRWLLGVPPLEILAHRVAWSALFLAGVFLAFRRGPDVARCLRTPNLLGPLTGSAVLVGVNWLVYIYSVDSQQIVQASLGYFLTPLVSLLLGLVLLRERLRGPQWLAVALAGAGVLWLVIEARTFPWIALSLAISFGLYGLVRKHVPVDGLVGLSIESLVLTPAALAYLGLLAAYGDVRATEVGMVARLALGGIVTAVPLLCFGQAARRLPLSSLSFLQYLSPSIQLLIATLVFGEAMPAGSAISFPLIWAALALFTADSVRAYRRSRQQFETTEPAPATVAVTPRPSGAPAPE